ncbi:MAG: hypothetical protein ACM3ZC_13325 [Bacteroidota bacterium]
MPELLKCGVPDCSREEPVLYSYYCPDIAPRSMGISICSVCLKERKDKEAGKK